MTLYCGIDLDSNNGLISVIDDFDHVVAEKLKTKATEGLFFNPSVALNFEMQLLL
jgi:hypothetical protein